MAEVKTKKLDRKATVRIATARNDITIPYYSTVLAPVDDTLISRGNGKGLKLYDEILRDTHAWSVIQKRVMTLIAREWVVEPGGEDPIDIEAADFLEGHLMTMAYDQMCKDQLDATLKGFSILEIVYKRAGSRVEIAEIVSHDQRRFVFDEKWNPRLLTMTNMVEGEQLPVNPNYG